ncbi:tRNA-uridine aminocarboxypropyltransferase [Bdellovibrio sp. KM01]|uniref:tRNA-uridine aminocarboxypropyltransferase n=1 Tax=Bdellovibrio sp. KM01 TaxID=2748865 RepID=UPI0015EA0887|nr:tRNA-uridine aminocarboxypropyltransferase [Bdellovibrio sp. KM01]QLY26557.1 DTW domain-containing protein [Bdellovibrio sp. KM01]
MDLQTYLSNKEKMKTTGPVYRELCDACVQPSFSCYCEHVKSFDPGMDVVILIHPIEMKRRIATGRMSYLVLDNSFLIRGQDYTNDAEVNELLQDPSRHCVMLYPGKNSANLSEMSESQKSELIPEGKRLTLFVIDGTWATAVKTIRQSMNLQAIPRICFSPDKPSNFRVRKQPKSFCYSTIEAIHQTIELVGGVLGFDIHSRRHDDLLYVFDKMVERQIECAKSGEAKPRHLRYSRDLKKQLGLTGKVF